jgi:hypothetical protein
MFMGKFVFMGKVYPKHFFYSYITAALDTHYVVILSRLVFWNKYSCLSRNFPLEKKEMLDIFDEVRLHEFSP